VIHRVVVHDDADWGEGEFMVTARVWEVVGDCGELWWLCDEHELARARKVEFGADDGETIAVNRVLPGPGGWEADLSIAPGIGIPMYPGRRYGFEIKGVEVDTFFDDDAGVLEGLLTEENSWGPLGKYLERGRRGMNPLDDGLSSPPCNVPGEEDRCIPAYFSVEYELRRAAVPDLSPTGIKVLQLAGTTGDTVCMGVVNRELGNAGPFQVALRVDDVIPPGGIADAGKLDSGQSGELCVQTTLPASARLSATVDEGRSVVEYNELNNSLEEPYVSARADPGDRPSVRPGVASTESGGSVSGSVGQPVTILNPVAEIPPAELHLGAVEVKARDGGRCVIRGDSNTVAVTVKNAGGRGAGQFDVEVKVGNERRGIQSVSGLDPNAERTVQIANVGISDDAERSLQVILDPAKTVTEGDENNNTRTIALDCTRR
jgi:hypothetical protein